MRRILLSAVTTLAAVLTPCRFSSGQVSRTSMLDVRITAAPRWVNGCLQFTVERVNTTWKPIYIPNRGLFAWSSTKLLRTSSKTEAKNRWVLIQGGSDVPDFEANPLPAHASIKDSLCLPQTVAVVDIRRETRRQILVRGLLKIEAQYFRTEEEWTINKTQHEEMFRLPPSKWPKVLNPQISSLEFSVPCSPKAQCGADCNTPPLIIEGEKVVFPDVFRWNKDWNHRGNELSETLLRKSSACQGQ